MTRSTRSIGALVATTFAAGALALTPVEGQAPAGVAKPWTLPRTPDGQPDLQGNWSNETQTPLERPGKQGATLTKEEAQAIEDRAKLVAEYRDQASDPNRPTPPKGGEDRLLAPGDPSFIERISAAAGGKVGGYNGFWLDPGDRVITIDGVARSSIIVDPPDGRVPALTAEARQRNADRTAAAKKFGEFDHPELRGLAERCLLSFGSNAGPPMLPNYFYNNNYQIVQAKDHVMIMTEMVHDVRIIRLGGNPSTLREPQGRPEPGRGTTGSGSGRAESRPEHPPKHVRTWLGDSIGRWEGDTLVVETTNFHPSQQFRGASENLKVTERFTRTGPDTIVYKFTIDDPTTFTAPWSGELPFTRIDEMIYEYACHEANYALSNILGGERAREKRESEKEKK